MAIACTALQTFERDCTNNIGGVQSVIFNNQDAISAITVDEATKTVTSVTATSNFLQLDTRKGTSNFTEVETAELINGSNIVVDTLSINPVRRSSEKSAALQIMSEGQKYLAMFVKDGNGKWWYFKEMQLISNGGGSGTNKPDGSKYEVQFANEVDVLASEIDEADVIALLTAV